VQLVGRDGVPVVLGKAVEEHRSPRGPIGNDHAKAAGSALARPGDALLDKAATSIGVDSATLGPLDGLFQARVRNPFAPRESRHPPGFENPHGLSYSAVNYSTGTYIFKPAKAGR
jgi:hypothetical protein